MNKFLRRLLLGTIISTILFFFGFIAFENGTRHFLPDLEEELVIRKLGRASLQVVDRHWRRPGSIPNGQDLKDFQLILTELTAINYSPLEDEAARLEAKAIKAESVHQSRVNRSRRYYQAFENRFGGRSAETIHHLLFGMSMESSFNRSTTLFNRVYELRALQNVQFDQRLNYAIALYLANEIDGGINQLRIIMRESPDYCRGNGFFIVAGRLKAVDDPQFLSEFKAIGLDENRLREVYTDDPVDLYPYELFDSNLPPR